MEHHFLFVNGQHCSVRSSDSRERIWDEITLELNELGPTNKTTTEWKRCFQDLKAKVNFSLNYTFVVIKPQNIS